MDSADLYKALLGLVTGALGTYFGLYWKIREELVAKYDQELRAERVKQYTLLWRATEPLAKYAAPGPVTFASLRQLAITLRQWYFSGGGMFLSDRARDAYFALQDAIAGTSGPPAGQTEDSEVPDDRETAMRKASSRLRTVLTADVAPERGPSLRNPVRRDPSLECTHRGVPPWPRCARVRLHRTARAPQHGGSLSATVMQVNRGAFTDE